MTDCCPWCQAPVDMSFEGYRIVGQRLITPDGSEIRLAKYEAWTLEAIFQRKGKPRTWQNIVDYWESKENFEKNRTNEKEGVSQRIHWLREKLQKTSISILNEWGQGYYVKLKEKRDA